MDSNWANISAARLEGMSTYYGSVISEQIFDELDLAGIGKMLAFTPNDEINNLAILHFMGIFDRSELYQLSHRDSDAIDRDQISPHLTGRILFSKEITYDYLARRYNRGAKIQSIQLTDKFDFKTFQEYYHNNATPLFVKTEDDELEVFALDNPPEPEIGHTLICLVNEEGKS